LATTGKELYFAVADWESSHVDDLVMQVRAALAAP